MTNSGSMPCSLHGCRNPTKHSSGRCHHHRRGGISPIRAIAAAPAITSEKIPVRTSCDGTEEWRLPSGVFHRDDGPAVTEHDSDGAVTATRWYRHGKLHRLDGPAITNYGPGGRIEGEFFYRKGNLHRGGDQPASCIAISGGLYENAGRVLRYFVDGRQSRIDGPSEEMWSKDGELENAVYRFADTRFSSSAELFAHLATLGEKRVAKAFASSVRYAPLIEEGYHPQRVAEILATGVQTPEGVREVLGGAPIEWVRSWEAGRE